MSFSSSFLAVLLCVVQAAAVDAQSCVKVDDCSCQTADGKRINLQSLGYKDSNTPMFPYVPGPKAQGWEYAYNPCFPFSDGSAECKNAIVCQRKQQNPSEIYNLGDVSTTWNNIGQTLYVEYSHTDGALTPVTRTSQVTLVCDPGADVPKLDRQGQVEGITTYIFTLTTKCACPGTCGTLPAPKPGISPGSVLCILFSVLVVAYFVGGVLFLRFRRNAQGKEMIPNYEMWVGVPGNIKDGLLFVTSCGKRTGYEEKM